MSNDYILPNGKGTRSFRKYFNAWRANGARLAELFGGGHTSSFDPGYVIDTSTGGRIEITREIGNKLLGLLDEIEKLRRENSRLKRRLK